MEPWIIWALGPLAVWILISGCDDLFVDLAFAWRRLQSFLYKGRFQWPTEHELERVPHRRIAIFVPLWHESGVIAKMLEHNLAAIRYDWYDFFVGVYPNDPETLEAVRAVQARDSRVHVAVNARNGPTSKADCLNRIFERMVDYEREAGVSFDIVMTHDAEDLIHPESLRLINYFGRTHDMVQVPVLALPTPLWELTHGLYCDDFAEFQSKDIPVRQFLGGFLPSNGVGTGYSRTVLEKLEELNGGMVFEPGCLTEDYENGYKIHCLGSKQIFLPIHQVGDSMVATREYFPRRFGAALRQRTRWTMGISLQGWEWHGWRAPLRQLYWFWRDRKGLVGNLIAPLTNLFFVYGAATWASSRHGRVWMLGMGHPAMRWVFLCTLALSALHLTIRGACVARIYGLRFALGVPMRAVWGNWLNSVATVMALWRYFAAKMRRQPMTWLKTEHAYPTHGGLAAHKRELGEVLVAQGSVDASLLETARQMKPAHESLGDYLVRMGLLTAEALCAALAAQQNLPQGVKAGGKIQKRATRALPAWVVEKCKVIPFRVDEGEIFVATSEVPTDRKTRELGKFSRLKIRYHLVTPGEFEEMAREYLP